MIKYKRERREEIREKKEEKRERRQDRRDNIIERRDKRGIDKREKRREER